MYLLGLSRFSHFYPRPPGGGRQVGATGATGPQGPFLSTPSGWRATLESLPRRAVRGGFLSTPSGWRATCRSASDMLPNSFLSTPSGWRATSPLLEPSFIDPISIHALRVEGDIGGKHGFSVDLISIHALRVEGDHKSAFNVINRIVISIHALRVEGDPTRTCTASPTGG